MPNEYARSDRPRRPSGAKGRSGSDGGSGRGSGGASGKPGRSGRGRDDRRDERRGSSGSGRGRDDRRASSGPGWRSEKTDWSERPDWGGVARRGAARVDPARGRTSGIQPPRSLPERPEGEAKDAPGAPVRPPVEEGSEEWILESVEAEAHGAVRRASRGRSGDGRSSKRANDKRNDETREVDRDAALRPDSSATRNTSSKSLFEGLGSAQRAKLLQERLEDASRAFKRERYGDAVKVLRPLSRDAPGVAEVRELIGLSYYRMGRWKDALRELRAFAELTGSTEQHPVLADCARALGRHHAVEDYWERLREASPDADLVAEGRIVMAGSLADRGQLDDAVALMESGRRNVKQPRERHLRMAYVLADLQERAGDLPAARSGFAWLARHDPEFADVADRLASLR